MSSLVSKVVRKIDEAIMRSAERTNTKPEEWQVKEFEVCIRIPNDIGWVTFLDRLEEFLRNEGIDDDWISIEAVPRINAGEYGWVTATELRDLIAEFHEAYSQLK